MRLIHLADLHLGYRAYHRTTGKGINRREADIFQAFQEALKAAAELKPDVVLIAGDVFHVPRPGNWALVQAQRELLAFRDRAAAEVIVIAGNHDSVRSADNRCILELMEIIPRVRVVTDRAEAIAACDEQIRVLCFPHNALEHCEQLSARPDSDFRYNLLMLHGTVDSDRINDYGGYDIPDNLLEMPWDYVACGHYHSFTHLGRNAYYAGAIERTSNDIWNEADEEKGFVAFDLETHTATFHALRSPRTTIDLPAIDAAGKEATEVDRALADGVAQIDLCDKIVRQRVLNLPKSVQRQLDHRQIRTFQNEAVHYLFEPRSPESAGIYAEADPLTRQGSLLEQAKTFLTDYTLPADVPRDRFVEKGLTYLHGKRE